MTQWAESTEFGRERGPAAVLRAWAQVLVRPGWFFERKVAPGDQAPGLTFAAAVVLVAETTRIALVNGAYPVVSGRPLASAVLWLLFLVVLVTPAGVHLTAALQTLVLMGTVEDRAGVSETVQVLCYAMAPCVLVGVPNPWVRFLATLWAGALLAVGVSRVHGVRLDTAVGVVAVPGFLLFGYGFGGYEALAFVVDWLADALDARMDAWLE